MIKARSAESVLGGTDVIKRNNVYSSSFIIDDTTSGRHTPASDKHYTRLIDALNLETTALHKHTAFTKNYSTKQSAEKTLHDAEKQCPHNI